MSPLLLLKVSVILSMALVAARLLNRAPATARHRLWSLAFAAMLLLPALAASLPALRVPVPDGWAAPAPSSVTPSTSSMSLTPVDSAPQAPASSDVVSLSSPTTSVVSSESVRQWPSSSSLLFAIWLTGVLGAVATVARSLWRVRRLARTAEIVRDDDWQSAATTIGRQLELRQPVTLLSTHEVSTPMAGGIWRPAVFLPKTAGAWTAEHRDLVLAHELAHLAGHDPLRHLMTRLALACYWFHPLAWLAAREAHIAREQACDETVLALGARPSAYARLLLELAESASRTPQPRLLGALPMVHRSHLEKRLMAILNVDLRPATRRLVAAPVIGVILLTLSVAAATPAFEQVQDQSVTGVVAGVPTSAVVGVPTGSVAGMVSGTVVGIPAGTVVGIPTGVVAGVQPVRATKADIMRFAEADLASQNRDSACWSDTRGNFTGSSNSNRVGGRTVVYDMVGWRDGDRVIQRTIGDMRLCMVAENMGDRDRSDADRPSQWIGRSRRVVMEVQRGGTSQRLEFSGSGSPSWSVNGSTRSFDAGAQTWRDRMLDVLDTTWEISTLQGQESSLRGQISSIEGQRSSLQGQISSLQGQVSSMQGRISSTQGQESSLRGQISSIQGHVSSLEGAISSEQGAISSLSASRYNASESERTRIRARIAEHDARIDRIERQIRDYDADAKIAAVEREIASYDARGRTRDIEDEIRRFDLDGKVAAIRRQIDALDVRGRVAAIERQIDALDVDRRVRRLEDRLDTELPRLNSAISAVR